MHNQGSIIPTAAAQPESIMLRPHNAAASRWLHFVATTQRRRMSLAALCGDHMTLPQAQTALCVDHMTLPQPQTALCGDHMTSSMPLATLCGDHMTLPQARTALCGDHMTPLRCPLPKNKI
jgi:hypothetical protein